MSNHKPKQNEKNNQSISDKIDEMNQTTNKKDIPVGIPQKQ